MREERKCDAHNLLRSSGPCCAERKASRTPHLDANRMSTAILHVPESGWRREKDGRLVSPAVVRTRPIPLRHLRACPGGALIDQPLRTSGKTSLTTEPELDVTKRNARSV